MTLVTALEIFERGRAGGVPDQTSQGAYVSLNIAARGSPRLKLSVHAGFDAPRAAPQGETRDFSPARAGRCCVLQQQISLLVENKGNKVLDPLFAQE